MKTNHLYFNNLYDCYGSLLTDKERLYFINYYSDDLSLKEIADNSGVSRSAVQKAIKTVEEKLEDYENKLNVLKNNSLLGEALNKDDIKVIKEIIEKVLNN